MTKKARSAIMLSVGVVLCYRPPALEAQALQQSDIAAVEHAAVKHVLEKGDLPQGEIGFDRELVGKREQGAVERSIVRGAALARMLGGRLVKKADVLKCPGNLSTCDLSVAALVRLGEVTPAPEGARVLVEVTQETGLQRVPIGRTVRELHLSKQDGKWAVIRDVPRSIS